MVNSVFIDPEDDKEYLRYRRRMAFSPRYQFAPAIQAYLLEVNYFLRSKHTAQLCYLVGLDDIDLTPPLFMLRKV